MAREPRMRSGTEEFDLITELRELIAGFGDAPPRLRVGIGDDAAVVETEAGLSATSVDATVEGVHFRSEWATPGQIGHKAMATALSDLAAMGAQPAEAYVWLGRPTYLDRDGCLELAGALAGLAADHGCTLAGGDLSAAPVIAVCVTVVGRAPAGTALIGRDGARVGDLLAVTGELGGAAAGLELLERPSASPADANPALPADSEGPTGPGDAAGPAEPSGGIAHGLSHTETAALIARQLEPTPRIAAGRAFAAQGVDAMIDLSDGLGADAGHLASASGVAIEIELERVPVAAGVRELVTSRGLDSALLILGGEDYELLIALRPEQLESAREAAAATGIELTVIGGVVPGSGVRISGPVGASIEHGGHSHRG